MVMIRRNFERSQSWILLLLYALSGFTALIYEVLWLKELTRLFGSSAYATATTLAVFFLGLFLGGRFWGKQSQTLRNPLRTYAFIEIGIALSAVLYFFILDIYFLIYPSIYASVGNDQVLFTIIKFFLAIGLLTLPAFLIGGTFPVLGQFLIKKKSQIGKVASLLYAINTIGAAVGALTAGYFLPPTLGIRTSYILTIALNALIATISFLLSRASKYEIPQVPSKGELRKEKLSQRKSWDFRKVSLLALLSGFITLSLEVLWTRMFAQVLMNDVYSFATILVTFLLSLAIGSFLARYLMIKEVNRIKTLRTLLILSGVLVGISPLLFSYWTDGLTALPVPVGWGGYILSLLRMSAVVTLLPTILMGSIFPFLLQIAPTFRYGIGETIGYLTAINTLGSIFGSMLAGFLFMKILGLWYSVALMAALYFLLSLLTIERPTLGKFGRYAGFAAALTLAFAFLPASGLSSVRLNPENAEELLDLRFGRDGIVSVISAQPSYYPEDFQDLFIRLNNTYTLGGVGSAPDEKRQSHLSLFLHPNPQSVYILGLATGISAGGALHHPVSRVVVSELVPEVVDVAESYFKPYNNGLFQDIRVQIVVDDGRNFLLGTDERFDVIIADLFEPWGAGTGDLYSLEHFQSVQAHLQEGGIFVQWLPLHQISLQEFGIIARTITEIFPQVTLWRGNFVPNKPIAALVASNEIKPLGGETMLANVRALGENPSTLIDALVSVKGYPALELDPGSEEFILQILPQLTESVPFTFYAGNIGHNKNLFAQYPLNSDDRPMFEFLAPKTRGDQPENRNTWLTSTNLGQLFEQLFGALPPENDPYLTKLSTTQISYIQAGLSYYKALTYSYEGQITGSTELIKDSQFLMDDYLERMNLADPDDQGDD